MAICFPGLVSRLGDGFEDDFNSFDIRLHGRCEAAFVADCGVVAALFEHALQSVEDLDAPAQGFRKGFRSHRHHHEFLKVHVVVGMRAAVQDVHHRGGQNIGAGPAEIAIERQAESGRGSSRCRHRNRQDGIGAQPALVLGAIEFDHLLVDGALVGGVHVGQGVGDFAVHIFYRLQHALAQIALLVAVAQLDRLVLAGRCAAGNGRASSGSVRQGDFRLDCGVAARIENLPRLNFLNLRDHVHDCWCASFFLCGVELEIISVFPVWRGRPRPRESRTNVKGRGRVARDHTLYIARVYDGSSSFSQAGVRHFCSRVDAGCCIARKLWLSARVRRNSCCRPRIATGFSPFPVFCRGER